MKLYNEVFILVSRLPNIVPTIHRGNLPRSIIVLGLTKQN